MNFANLYIRLSGGECLTGMVDHPSAPKVGLLCEKLLKPLLQFNDHNRELALLKAHCTLNVHHCEAKYRYHLDLVEKTVGLYTEAYDQKSRKYRKGKDLTHRLEPYLITVT